MKKRKNLVYLSSFFSLIPHPSALIPSIAASDGSGRGTSNQIVESGGSVSKPEKGCPCQGTGSAARDSKLPTPFPPYLSASVFKICSY
jgi:hypothetical protein